MEMDDLEIFVAVALEGNFSRAAQNRGVAVSSIARRIDLLEASTGARLLNRGTRGVQLTDAGQAFLTFSHRVIAELASVRDVISSADSVPKGLLRVTAPATFGRRHVAPAVATFLKRYPEVSIELDIRDDIVDLITGRFDVAIRIGVLPDSDLIASTIAPQRRVVVASPEYLARAGTPATIADLLLHNCLTHAGHPGRVGWWQFSGVNDGRPLDVQGTLRTDDSESLMRAALEGVGIAHLATWLVGEQVRAGRLVVLFASEMRNPASAASSIHALRVAGRSALKSRAFIDHLRQAFFGDDGRGPYWERDFPIGL